jgi:hypothetical protein
MSKPLQKLKGRTRNATQDRHQKKRREREKELQKNSKRERLADQRYESK